MMVVSNKVSKRKVKTYIRKYSKKTYKEGPRLSHAILGVSIPERTA